MARLVQGQEGREGTSSRKRYVRATQAPGDPEGGVNRRNDVFPTRFVEHRCRHEASGRQKLDLNKSHIVFSASKADLASLAGSDGSWAGGAAWPRREIQNFGVQSCWILFFQVSPVREDDVVPN